MVRRVAQNLSGNELEQVLERIPPKERSDLWATIARESFTEAQLADSRRKLGVSVDSMERILAGSPWFAGPIARSRHTLHA